ncbi:hypothetical protein AGMMS49959_04380 [Planctomycetales bacterium]|nr:hypothetical protein AGMMS49959_04380 [Planctomycetales bacterium]
MGIVEMLKQPDCPRCEDAKAMLTKLGYQVVEISVGTLISRPDRDDLMAAVSDNNGQVPLMRLQGERWVTAVEELFELNRAHDENRAHDDRDKGVSW